MESKTIDISEAKIEQSFEAVDDNKTLRVLTPVQHKAEYTRKQLIDLRVQKTNELSQIISLLAKMDELGIE